MSDAENWDRVLEGDAQAFAVCFDRHRDPVFRSLLRAVEQAHEAEDLTATVFLELWRRRHRVNLVDGSLLPWLLATATNVGRNAARSRRRYRSFLAKLPPPDVSPDSAAAVAQRLDAERTAGAIRARLSGLPLKDQQLVELVSLDGVTVSAAAEALGLKDSAAKMRLARLRARVGNVEGTP